MFQCQPTRYLVFELVTQSDSNFLISTKAKTLGSCYISMEEFFGPVSKLSVEKWLDLVHNSGTISSEPIRIRVAASCTFPIPAPLVVQVLLSSPLRKISCYFPLPGMVRFTKSWTQILNVAGDEIIRLRMRDFKGTKGIADNTLTKAIIGFTGAGEALVLGHFLGH